MINKAECYEQALQRVRNHRHRALERANMRRDVAMARYPELAEIERSLTSVRREILRAKLSGSEIPDALQAEHDALMAHRTDFLQSLAMEPDAFEPGFNCAACQDTGMVDGRYCRCVKNIVNQTLLRQLCRNLPEDSFTFDNFSLAYYEGADREKMERNLAFCRRYADEFSTQSENLHILGSTGIGKTHLTVAMAKEIAAKGFDVIYCAAQTMITDLEREHFGQADQPYSQFYLNADLLILDDLGTEFLSSVAQAELYHVIDSRILTHLPTVINSNLTPKELEKRYGERLASRILGCYTSLHFVGKDIRIQNRLASKKI